MAYRLVGIALIAMGWAVVGCQQNSEASLDLEWPAPESGAIKVEEPLAPDKVLLALDPDGKVTTLSKQYAAPPEAPNPGMLAYKEDYLVINLIDRVMSIWLDADGKGFLEPGFRLDTHLSDYNAIGSVIDGPRDFFIVAPLGEGDVPITLFAAITIVDVWSALDYASAQFDEPSSMWVGASYATTQTTRIGFLDGDRTSFSLRRPFEGDVWLAPGGGGRLAALGGRDWQDTRPAVVFDPVSERAIPIRIPGSDEWSFSAWVDQGHIFAFKGGKIVDFGRLKTVPKVKASEDASRLSPWSVVRSEDKKTLTVKSIYSGGPKYVLHRPGRVWTQNTCLYGLHALYDQGEFYDLRNGKLALTITFEPGNSGEFMIQSPSGVVSGSEKMLQKHHLLNKANSAKIAALLKDLLQRRTPRAEAAYKKVLDRQREAWSEAPE